MVCASQSEWDTKRDREAAIVGGREGTAMLQTYRGFIDRGLPGLVLACVIQWASGPILGQTPG